MLIFIILPIICISIYPLLELDLVSKLALIVENSMEWFDRILQLARAEYMWKNFQRLVLFFHEFYLPNQRNTYNILCSRLNQLRRTWRMAFHCLMFLMTERLELVFQFVLILANYFNLVWNKSSVLKLYR